MKVLADFREDTPKLIVMSVSRPELEGSTLNLLKIALPLSQMSNELVFRLKAMLGEFPGTTPVQLLVGEKLIQLPPEFNVDPRAVIGEVRTLLGPNALVH